MVFKKSILFFAVIFSSYNCFSGEVSDAIATLNIQILKTYLDNRKITQTQKEKYLDLINNIIRIHRERMAKGERLNDDIASEILGLVSLFSGVFGMTLGATFSLFFALDHKYKESVPCASCAIISFSWLISGAVAYESGMKNKKANEFLAAAISIKKYIARYPVSEINTQAINNFIASIN